VSRVGPNARSLKNEIEKLCVFTATGRESNSPTWLRFARGTNGRAFALGDALATAICRACSSGWTRSFGRRNLIPKKSEIGLLYGLIPKSRAILLLKEMLREG